MKKHYSPSDIQYDPKPMRNKNVWMHSVEKHGTRNHGALYYIILMSFPLAILLIYLILG